MNTMNENDRFTQKVHMFMLKALVIIFFALSIGLIYQRDNLKRENNLLKTKIVIAESGLRTCTHLPIEKDQESHDAKGCE